MSSLAIRDYWSGSERPNALQRATGLRPGCNIVSSAPWSLVVSHVLRTCHQRKATVFLGLSQEPDSKPSHQFCAQCADDYFARTPGMNSHRGLICLSDSYRSKLYDLLEAAHPEAFDNSDTDACYRGSELMQSFLREQLTKDKIKVNNDAFEMLCCDFFGSHHYYSRVDEHKRKND